MKTEKKTVYRCENCNTVFYNKEEAERHEKECVKKRINVKKVSISFDNMDDDHFFNISVSVASPQKTEDVYKVMTFDSEVEDDYLIYVRKWYMYIPVDDSADKAIHLLFEKAQSDLTKCIEELRGTVNNFMKDNHII